MTGRTYVLWVCFAVACCFVMGALIVARLSGVVVLIPSLAAMVPVFADIRTARRLKREMREWLDG